MPPFIRFNALNMKNTKKKKPLNKWKLTAIISLVINGIVALLLVVGLATPKTYAKTNAYTEDFGEYYIYEQSPNVHKFSVPESETYESYDFIQTDSTLYCTRGTQGEYLTLDVNFRGDYFGQSYLDTSNVPVIKALSMLFKRYYGETYILYRMYLYPRVATGLSSYYSVIDINFTTGNIGNISYSCYNLGQDSQYALINRNVNSQLVGKLNNLFYNRGTNEVIKDYQIEDNFNPNKFVSIATASNGLLYDSPTSFFNQDSRVTWTPPIYRGKTTTSEPYDCSTLGFLEVPLLFTSGGENFVGIRYYFDVVQQYIDQNKEVQTLNYGSSVVLNRYYYTFVYMSYCYQLSTQSGTALTSWREKVVTAVPVYRIDVDYTDDGVNYRNFVYCPFQPLKWLDDSYKTLGVYQASTEQLAKVGINENVSRSRWAINQYTIEQILNYDMTQNASGVNTGNYIGNVFTLIKQAFDSLTGILALSILPGISIGVLLFLPLVLTIIIVVIKLVKR